jgi:hypothetical protein
MIEEIVLEIKCKTEELTFLASFVLDSFKRDKADFIAFSPDYADPFDTGLQTKIEEAETIVAPKKLMGELKNATTTLRKDYTRCRNMVNKLERYVEKAYDDNLTLTIAPGDFGFKATRATVNLKNDEGIVKNLTLLKDNMAANVVVLEPKGFNKDVQAELQSLIADVLNDSKAQTRKKKEWETLIQNNAEKLNKLWYQTKDILKTGKTIYKEKNGNKIKDYTYEHVIADIRQRRRQKEETVKS